MEFNEKWNQLSVREKIILMILIPVVMYAMVQIFVANPIDMQIKNVEAKIQKNSKNVSQILKQIQTTQNLLEQHSIIKLEKQQKNIKLKVIQQENEMKQLLEQLVPPQIMAKVIEKMLRKRGNLKLLSLANMEAIPLNQNEAKKENKNQESIVYQHPLRIEFSGKYFDVISYLKDLENSDYGFYWDAINYQVIKYPQAKITLQLSTLGTTLQWMGASNE